jgi:ferric-chelate reductase
VWVIRDASHANWIVPALREALDAPSNTSYPLDIDVRIFVTRSGAEGLPIALEEKETKVCQHRYVDVHIEIHKSDTNGVVSGVAQEAEETLADVIEREGGCVYFESGKPDIRKVIDEELAESDGLNVSVDGELSIVDLPGTRT